MSTDEPPPAPTADAICARGYFPRELPSAFTTVPFALAQRQVPGRPPRTECATHTLTRVSGPRRLLRVPNPRAFAELARVTERLWPLLRDHLRQSTTAISTPAVSVSERGRAIRPRRRFGEKSKYSARIRARGRVVLQTDINRFYGSVYTHAIPWALHGRDAAKASLKTRTRLPGDELDRALQALSHSETAGIPIGPDPSFLAAEVLLTAVDVQIQDKHPDLHWFRYLDDYEFACSSRDEAETLLSTLESALEELRLATNPAKTVILDLPAPFQASWTYEFQRFDVRQDNETQTANDLFALFNRASEMTRDHPGALKYALLVCREVEIPSRFWPTFQHLVWTAVLGEPTTLPTALALLVNKSASLERDVNEEETSAVLDGLVRSHAPVGNGSQVIWALWASIVLKTRLSHEAAEAVSAMEDDFVALVALEAEERGVFEGALNRQAWTRSLEGDDALHGPHWLLAYEGTMQGWLREAEDLVVDEPFFKRLRRQGVSFFDATDPGAGFDGPAGPLPGTLAPDEDYA